MKNISSTDVFFSGHEIYAEVVTHVASSLWAKGLHGYPKVFYVEINMIKS